MIDHMWAAVCSRALIDIDSKGVSLRNVLEQINVATELSPDLVIGIPYEIVSF